MRTLLSKAALLTGVAAAIGVQAVVTGDRACGKIFCVQGMHDSNAKLDTYTIEAKADAASLDQIGWMAVGFGTKMDNAPSVIVWPDGQGSFVLSQRNPNGYKPPTVAEALTRRASLVADKSFANASIARAVFTLPADSVSDETNLIWAFSGVHPDSTDAASPIKIHTETGYMTLALNSPVQGGAASGESTLPEKGSNTGKGEPFKGRLGIMLIHAVCGGLACLLVIPAAVLVPRIARGLTRDRRWFPVHAAANGVVGFLLVLVCFQVAVTQFHKGFHRTHRALGLLMFILMCLHVLLGIGVHWIKTKRHRFTAASGRGPSNYIHMVLGVICMGIGWATVWTGFDGWDYFSGAEPMSKWYRIGWMAVVSSWAIAYLGGLVVCLPRQLRAEREARENATRIDKAMIRLQDQSATHLSLSTNSGGIHAAMWPNKYGEDKEVLSPGGTTVLAPGPALSVTTSHRTRTSGGSAETYISPMLVNSHSRYQQQSGNPYLNAAPAERPLHQQPLQVIGEMSPLTARQWSNEPLSPVREVVLGGHENRAEGMHQWDTGHMRQRSNGGNPT